MHCKGLGELWSTWGQRFQLVVFLVFGTVFAFAHHGLGVYLANRPVPRDISICGMRIRNQTYVSALSNALSQVVKFLFANTIGVAFAQYFFFWSGRRGYVKVGLNEPRPRVLDAPLAAANGNPFTFSALPTWRRSLGLAIISLAMLSMITIPIFVPGSLVPVQGNLWQRCTIRSPNTTKAYLTKALVSYERRDLTDSPNPAYHAGPSLTRNLNPIFETTAIVKNIITTGTYLPVPSPCGVCAYQVNFTAASLDCSSAINSTYNFLTNLPSNANDTLIPLFNGNITRDNVLTLATRDGVGPHMSPPAAVSCNAFQAQYVVQVRHDNCASRIDVLNVTRGSRLSGDSDPSTDQLNGLIRAVGGAFTGRVVLRRDSDDLNEGATLAIAYSPLLRWTTINGTSTFTWSNLTTSLPSLMQNISLSFLSGRFPASDSETYMDELKTQCLVAQLVYKYDHTRLLSIYAAGWGTAAIFFCLGLYVIVWKNLQEHNLDFSHVIEELIAPSLESEKKPESTTMGYQSLGDEDDVGGVHG